MGARKIAEVYSEAELIREVSRLISEITGVQLGEKQFTLVQGRLGRRMRELKITTPLEYSRYLNANESVETGVLTSLLTTHHTFFFREFQHFEFLLNKTLPELIKNLKASGRNKIRILSAACSRGHEVYSLAMYLKHHLNIIAPEITFEIVGTDICEESIKIAKNGVYSWEELRSVPSVYLQGNWSRGTGAIADYVRAKESIRQNVTFKVQNLQEIHKAPFGHTADSKFDIIFCRNVFIYFSHAQIKKISAGLLDLLTPWGHLFVGLSESLNGMELPVNWIGPSVYTNKTAKPETLKAKVFPFKTDLEKEVPKEGYTQKTPSPPQIAPHMPFEGLSNSFMQPGATRTLRVLCVDDSPTVLLLLKKILGPESGCEIVGTAVDGLDAAEKARALKPDVITLDIHMPKMTGVEYLERFQHEIRIPVVIVSSVPRDDASLAFRCLELGATDYIEKPSVQNLDKVQEELLFKLRTAVAARATASVQKQRSGFDLDASFKRTNRILNPSGKLRIVIAHFAARDQLLDLLQGFKSPQPATLVLVEGASELWNEWSKKAAARYSMGRTQVPARIADLPAHSITFMELEKGLDLVRREALSVTSSCLVIGPVSKAMVSKINSLPVPHLILEDRGLETPRELMMRAKLVAPITSFVYESDRFFSDKAGDKS